MIARSSMRRGFSLIELMVVLSVVGIMSALAATGFAAAKATGGVASETRKLVRKLQSARSLSVSTGIPHGVIIGGPDDDLFRHEVVIFRKLDPTSQNLNFSEQTTTFPGDYVLSAERIERNDDKNNYVVLIRGQMGGMPDATLEGTARSNRQLRIVFNPADGRPVIWDSQVNVDANKMMQNTTSAQIPFTNASLPFYVQFRDRGYDTGAPTGTNEFSNPTDNKTRRRVEVRSTGTVRVATTDY